MTTTATPAPAPVPTTADVTPAGARTPDVTAAWDIVPSPVGDLLLTASGAGLTGLYLPGQRTAPATPPGTRDPRPFAAVREQLSAYFAGELRTFDLPLAPVGTAFQLRVWAALRAIPYATTASYGALAATIGAPGAARAVGLANGRNPISIVVPCHRVVGSGGALTGYAGGLAAKRHLLDLEAGVRALPA